MKQDCNTLQPWKRRVKKRSLVGLFIGNVWPIWCDTRLESPEQATVPTLEHGDTNSDPKMLSAPGYTPLELPPSRGDEQVRLQKPACPEQPLHSLPFRAEAHPWSPIALKSRCILSHFGEQRAAKGRWAARLPQSERTAGLGVCSSPPKHQMFNEREQLSLWTLAHRKREKIRFSDILEGIGWGLAGGKQLWTGSVQVTSGLAEFHLLKHSTPREVHWAWNWNSTQGNNALKHSVNPNTACKDTRDYATVLQKTSPQFLW